VQKTCFRNFPNPLFLSDCYKVGKEGYKSNSGATEQVAPEIQKKGVSR
jgi:hypothetical protein